MLLYADRFWKWHGVATIRAVHPAPTLRGGGGGRRRVHCDAATRRRTRLCERTQDNAFTEITGTNLF